MMLRFVSLALVAATSIGAQAALVTYAPWEAAYTGNGLSGVLFDVNSAGGVTTAMGAHAYKNGVFLANDGVGTFTAQNGVYLPDGLNRANWSFDFGYSLGNCTGCQVFLGIDTDMTAAVSLSYVNISSHPTNPESWNMEMAFIDPFFGTAFNPFGASSTAFSLQVRDAAGAVLTESDITVNVPGALQVPEPGSLALAGLALASLAALRRRKG